MWDVMNKYINQIITDYKKYHEAKAQKREVTCSRSYRLQVTELEFKFGPLVFGALGSVTHCFPSLEMNMTSSTDSEETNLHSMQVSFKEKGAGGGCRGSLQ